MPLLPVSKRSLRGSILFLALSGAVGSGLAAGLFPDLDWLLLGIWVVVIIVGVVVYSVVGVIVFIVVEGGCRCRLTCRAVTAITVAVAVVTVIIVAFVGVVLTIRRRSAHVDIIVLVLVLEDQVVVVPLVFFRNVMAVGHSGMTRQGFAGKRGRAVDGGVRRGKQGE